jgi:DNA-binding HxlR family transcriptional regulator
VSRGNGILGGVKQRKSHGKPGGVRRSPCPVANALDIIGDKWTLLLIRDLFFGKKIYREFLESPEGIPTNILADRLKRLEEYGVVKKAPYQDRPVRYAYALTPKGEKLGPILQAVSQWGESHIPGTKALMRRTKP